MTALTTSLPIPDNEALSHSSMLVEYLKKSIQSQSSWLSFAEFMQGLLYAPGLGYYAAGAAKFGSAGDFITAPELSPLFGRSIAQFVAPSLQSISGGCILEPGAGTGRLAATLLQELQRVNALPDRYLILEPSPSLQAIQLSHLTQCIPSLVERVEWVHAMPEKLRGIVIANEVLDAMPVHLMVTTEQKGVYLERGVTIDSDEEHFTWLDRPCSQHLNLLALKHLPNDKDLALEPGTVFELGLPAEAWCRSLADKLQEGQIILIDYGFPAREFYHPQRRNGTLMCHYRHHAHDDPFLYPGLQDVTAHVDFTAVARALCEQGLHLDSYQTQAAFLLGAGVLETIQLGLEPGSVAWLKETTALQKLLSPAEMGELFKVIIASRGMVARQDTAFSSTSHQRIEQQLGL
jgi:hypothetical protein